MQYQFTLVPQGMFPVQAEGELANGQCFHFKQRGASATLTIVDRPIASLDLGQTPNVIAVYKNDVEPLHWNEPDIAGKVMPSLLALLDVHERNST